jgi:hypothetical protein
MDIYCPKCGEPFEIDTLHEFVAEQYPSEPWKDENGKYNQAEYERIFDITYDAFKLVGCNAINFPHNKETLNPQKNGIYGILMEFAGDDIDFAASMMDEAESWGLLD